MKNVKGLATADRQHPATAAALRVECPRCGAVPGQRCKALHLRIVHYARCTWKTS